MTEHNRISRQRPWRLAALAFAMALTPAVHAQTADSSASKPAEPEPAKAADAVQLPQVDVEGQRDALGKSDKRLRDKKKNLPTLGTDKAPDKDRVDKALDRYNSLEKDPNQLDQGTQDFLERTVKAPDSNHAQDKVVLPRRDAEDYEDPVAAQQKYGPPKKP